MSVDKFRSYELTLEAILKNGHKSKKLRSANDKNSYLLKRRRQYVTDARVFFDIEDLMSQLDFRELYDKFNVKQDVYALIDCGGDVKEQARAIQYQALLIDLTTNKINSAIDMDSYNKFVQAEFFTYKLLESSHPGLRDLGAYMKELHIVSLNLAIDLTLNICHVQIYATSVDMINQAPAMLLLAQMFFYNAKTLNIRLKNVKLDAVNISASEAFVFEDDVKRAKSVNPEFPKTKLSSMPSDLAFDRFESKLSSGFTPRNNAWRWMSDTSQDERNFTTKMIKYQKVYEGNYSLSRSKYVAKSLAKQENEFDAFATYLSKFIDANDSAIASNLVRNALSYNTFNPEYSIDYELAAVMHRSSELLDVHKLDFELDLFVLQASPTTKIELNKQALAERDHVLDVGEHYYAGCESNVVRQKQKLFTARVASIDAKYLTYRDLIGKVMTHGSLTRNCKNYDRPIRKNKYLTNVKYGLNCIECQENAGNDETFLALPVCRAGLQSSMPYALAEAYWYRSATQSIDQIVEFGKIWKHMTDKDGFVNSNYGYQITNNQNWDVKMHTLLTAGACSFDILTSSNVKSKSDVPCNDRVIIEYDKANSRLDVRVFARSIDLIYGLPYDVFAAQGLGAMVIESLYQHKDVKNAIRLRYVTFDIANAHIYESDFESAWFRSQHKAINDYDLISNKHTPYTLRLSRKTASKLSPDEIRTLRSELIESASIERKTLKADVHCMPISIVSQIDKFRYVKSGGDTISAKQFMSMCGSDLIDIRRANELDVADAIWSAQCYDRRSAVIVDDSLYREIFVISRTNSRNRTLECAMCRAIAD